MSSKKLPCTNEKKNVNLQQSPSSTFFSAHQPQTIRHFFGFAYWQCWELPGPVKPMVSAAKASVLPWLLRPLVNFSSSGLLETKKKTGVVFFGCWGNLFKQGPEVILFLAESFPPRIGVEKFSSEKSGVKSHPVSVKVNGSVGKVTEIGRGNFLFGGKSDCNPLKY